MILFCNSVPNDTVENVIPRVHVSLALATHAFVRTSFLADTCRHLPGSVHSLKLFYDLFK